VLTEWEKLFASYSQLPFPSNDPTADSIREAQSLGLLAEGAEGVRVWYQDIMKRPGYDRGAFQAIWEKNFNRVYPQELNPYPPAPPFREELPVVDTYVAQLERVPQDLEHAADIGVSSAVINLLGGEPLHETDRPFSENLLTVTADPVPATVRESRRVGLYALVAIAVALIVWRS
jgi:hypothetical protein